MTLNKQRAAAVLLAVAPFLSGCTPEEIVINSLVVLVIAGLSALVIAIIST